MWKFSKRIIAVFFVLVLAASLAILCLVAEARQSCEEPQPEVAPQATGKEWTVVFKLKDAATEPQSRFYIVVRSETEGGAAIDASKFLYDKLQPGPYSNLVYLEAQQKK